MSDRPKCFNRQQFKSFVKVQNGWLDDGRANFVYIEDKMSKNCHQNEEPFGEAFIAKWNCEGCKWR